MWLMLDDMCSIFHVVLMLPQWVITKSSIWILYKVLWNGYSGSILLSCVAMCYPFTKWSKYSDCTVIPSKHLEITFHHHCQACLIPSHYIGQDQIPLLMHMISCRIYVGQIQLFYKPDQTHLTWTKCDLDDLNDPNTCNRYVDLTWF